MARDPWHYPRTDLADQYLKTLDICSGLQSKTACSQSMGFFSSH